MGNHATGIARSVEKLTTIVEQFVAKERSCPFKGVTTSGETYCRFMQFKDDSVLEYAQCPYMGNHRSVMVLRNYGLSEYREIRNQKVVELARDIEESGEALSILRRIRNFKDKLFGNKELDVNMSIEYSCSYEKE